MSFLGDLWGYLPQTPTRRLSLLDLQCGMKEYSRSNGFPVMREE